MSIEDKLDRMCDLLQTLIDIQLKPPAIAEIKTRLNDIAEQRAIKDFYSVGEVAVIVERSANQVRQWCINGRIKATKRPYGRGLHKEWMIDHEELTRYRSLGLRAKSEPQAR
jgi:hypothetical protein